MITLTDAEWEFARNRARPELEIDEYKILVAAQLEVVVKEMQTSFPEDPIEELRATAERMFLPHFTYVIPN